MKWDIRWTLSKIFAFIGLAFAFILALVTKRPETFISALPYLAGLFAVKVIKERQGGNDAKVS